MGALQSIRENLPDFEEAKAVETSTPNRPINKRLLSLDPRSPSENIERTPIIVEKTPMLGPSALATSQETPVSAGRINDPRSPTTDFTRTPINPCTAAERQSSRYQHAVLDSRPSTLTLGSESGIESAEVTPVKDLPVVQRVESPDSAFSTDDIHPELNTANESADNSTASSIDDRKPLMVESSTDKDHEGTPKLPALRSRPIISNKLNQPIISNKLNQLAMLGDKLLDSPAATRSPLSNVGNARTGLSMQHNKVRLSENEDQPPARSANKENLFS